MSWQRKVEPQSQRLRWKNLFLNGFSHLVPHDAVQRPCLVVWPEFETATFYSTGALLIKLTRQLCGLQLGWGKFKPPVTEVVGRHSRVTLH